jgi:hypothetical protein
LRKNAEVKTSHSASDSSVSACADARQAAKGWLPTVVDEDARKSG